MLERCPSIRVHGGPRHRGRQYGEAARERVRISRECYEEAFGRTAGWTWAQARDAAAAYLGPVGAAYPQYVDEMRGIAEGAGLAFEDVLTLNTRTEVMYAAKARQAAALGRGECTAFALSGARTASGRPLAGQNWDWLTHCFETVVVLEVDQPDAPNFVTVVEAGLLAKASLNAAGLAVVTNALVTSADRGRPGLPYHVLLRALADCETPRDGVAAVLGHVRSSSANYLLVSGDGLVIDLEAGPGDYRDVSLLEPDEGVLVHTNHFLRPPPGQDDVSVWAMPDTHLRRQRALPALADPGRRHEPESLRGVLADHAGFPFGVCSHPDPRVADGPAWATITAVVVDPAERRLWRTAGPPCEEPLAEVDLGGLLHEPTPLAKYRPTG